MEDIEYLEEYEDLVLPALNSAAAEAAATSSVSYHTNKSAQNRKTNDADDSSSSLDQDIFNCLFDDNSDDDFNEYENIDNQTALKDKSDPNEYFEALDEKIDEIDEKVEISLEDPINKVNTIAENKTIPSTRKIKSFMTKTSGTTIPLNTTSQTAIINKTKSIATVRPTVQNQHQQGNLNEKSTPSSSTSSFIQQEKPSTSAALTSPRSAPLPATVHKPLPSATTLSSSSVIREKPATSTHISTTVVKKVTKRPATIVKPEQIVTKDPPYDPLDLDDLSEAVSGNDSLSDISGSTFNSISDFEDEQSDDEYFSGDEDYYEEDQEGISSSSQVIELSNDSSSAPSNLEEFRAPTPSPVISDDSETRSSSSSFKISTIKSVKPYSHPDIIDSVLTKGEKPKLLELLHKYNLLENSLETFEEDNTIIDITTSRENLVESLDTQQDENCKTNPPPTTLAIDIVNINLTDNNTPLTLNTLNKNLTKSSKKTNKNKSKKKSVPNMDATNDSRDLKSPGEVSTDSDLSAVEELLEESYAEAMKKVNDVPFSNQEMGAEVENTQDLPNADVVINYEAENNTNIEQNNTQIVKHKEIETEIMEADQKNTELNEPEKLLKKEAKEINESDDVQIIELSEQSGCSLKQEGIVNEDCQNNKELNKQEKLLKSETKGISEMDDVQIIEQTDCPLKQQIVKEDDKNSNELLEPDKLLKSEIKETSENNDVQIIAQTDCSLKKEVVKEGDNKLNDPEKLMKSETKENAENDDVQIIELSEQTDCSSKQKGIVKDSPEKAATGSRESAKILDRVETSTFNSPNAKKKKRFRNLVSPEPTASEAAMGTDDTKDFKGFEEEEEVQSRKSVAKSEKHKKIIHSAKETEEKSLENVAKKDRPPGSFKSPSNSHQSLKDKSKESKSNNSRDSSKESRDKSARHSKSSRDSSKDRSSRESSRDKSSREGSKDRSRESSKDLSKQSHNKSSAGKHHHRDHRKSSDSKDSSKSRESSKSRDSKDTRNIKADTEDSRKSASIKRDLLPDSNKDKSTVKKDHKKNESGNHAKEIINSSTEDKMSKEQPHKKELKEVKKISSDASKSSYPKNTQNTKMSSEDPNKSSTIKRDLSLERRKEKSSENEDKKVGETNNPKKIDKSSKESKITNEQDNKKDLIELKKNSSEKSDNIATETVQNRNEKNCGKTLTNSTKQSKDTHTSSSSSTKSDPNIRRDPSKESKIITKIDLTKSSPELNKSDQSKTPKVSTNLNKSLTKKPSTSVAADNANKSKSIDKPTVASKSVQEKNADKSLQKSTVPKKMTTNLNDKSINIKNTPEKKTTQNTKSSSTDLNKSMTSSKSVECLKKDPQKTIKPSSSDSMINKMDGQTDKNIDVNKAVNEKNQPIKIPIKADTPTKIKNQSPLKQVSKEPVATTSDKKQPEESHTKPSNSETKDTNSGKPAQVNIQKTKAIIESVEIKSKEQSFDFKKPKESEHAKSVETKNKDTSKISMSPKRSPRPKNDSIKSNEQGNSNNTAKTKQQPISKNEAASTATISEKVKTDEVKCKTDENKTHDSKNTLDTTTNSEKSKINADKKEVNSKATKNKPKQNVGENEASSDSKQPKQTKINKNDSKDACEKAKETNKASNALIKEEKVKDTEKHKTVQTPKNEQREKSIEKNKIPEASNKEQKGTDTDVANKERNETEMEKNTATIKNQQKEKLSEESKIPESSNKEQKAKASETTKVKAPETPKNDRNKGEVDKDKIPVMASKEQKEKETSKNKDLGTPIKTTIKGKASDILPASSNTKQNKKELKEKTKVTEAPSKEQKGKETKKNKVMESAHKTQKEKDMEKTNIPEISNTQQIGKETARKKLPETPNKEQKETNTAGNNNTKTSSKEQKGKDTTKNKASENTNKELNKKEMETNRILETPNKDHKVKEIEKKEIAEKRNKEQSKKGNAKNKITETPTDEQKRNETLNQNLPETSHKEEQEVEKTKSESHSKEQKKKETPKGKAPETPNKEQKEKDQTTITKDANDTNKSESVNDQTATKTEKQTTTNKAKTNDNKTTKTESSSKICKTSEKQHEKIPKDPIKDLEERKQELKIKEIITTKEEKIELMTENPPDHSIELKIKSDSQKSDKEFVETNRNQQQIKVDKSKGNVTEETKQNENSLSSDTNLKQMKTAELPEASLKSHESPALKKSFKYGAANESEKIRTIMESVLEKSVVVVIEPLKSIPHANTNVDDKNPIEPRRTRSRTENPKLDDSIRKEELSKNEISENTETKRLKFSETSTLKNISEKKPEKPESERHNTEISQAKDMDVKSEAIKSDNDVEKTTPEISETCQDDLTTESKLSEGEKPTVDCCKKEIEKVTVGPVKTRRRGDPKHETEIDKSKCNYEMSEEKYSTQKETEKQSSESKKAKRRTDQKGEIKTEKVVAGRLVELSDEKNVCQNKTEANTSKSINTRSRVDLQAEVTKEDAEILPKETFEEKCSSSMQEKELSETDKTGNNQDLTDTCSEENVEPRITRSRVDIKDEALKGKGQSTDIESAGVRKSAPKEADDHIEPIKTKKHSDLKTDAIKEKTKIELSDEKTCTKKEIEAIKTRRRADISEEALDGNSSAPNDPKQTRSLGEVKDEGLNEKKKMLEGESLEDKGSEQKESKDEGHGDVKAETDKEKAETTQSELSEEKSSTNRESEALNTKKGSDLKEEAEKDTPKLPQVENLESVKTRRRGDLKVEPNKEKPEITKVDLPEQESFSKNENEPVKTRRRGDPKQDILKQKSETLQIELSSDKCSTQKELKEEHQEPIKTRRRGDLKSEGETQVGLLSEEKSYSKIENEPVKARTRADLKEETVEKSQVVSSDDKKSDQKELAEENLDRAKSKKLADLKTETVKEKLQISRASPSGAKMPIQQQPGKEISTPIKTKGAVKEIIGLAQLQSSNKTTSVEENAKKGITETITTRKRAETANEKSPVQKSTKEILGPQTTTTRRGDPKEEVEKNQQEICQSELTQKEIVHQKEREEEGFVEPPTKRRRIETAKDEEKSSAPETTETVIVEQITTRSRGDIKREAGKDLPEASQVELTQKKLFDQKQPEDNVEPITRRSRGDSKSEHGKNKDEKVCTEKSNETIIIEPITTRSRGDPKKETEKVQLETPQVELTPKTVCDQKEAGHRSEHITTRKRGDAKSETGKNKDEKNTETITVEQMTTRSRGDPKAEAEKDQQEASQLELPHKKIIDHRKAEDHFEPITTRKHGDTKTEAAKTKTENTSNQKNSEKTILEQATTRRRADTKAETEKDQQEQAQVEDHFEPITTRRRGGIILESAKDKDEIPKAKSTEEKCLPQENIKSQTEEQHFEPRRTRSRLDLKEEAGKDKHEMGQKNVSLDSIDKQSSEGKSRTEDKNVGEKSTEQIEIDNCKDTEKEKVETVEVHHLPQHDSQNQTEENLSEPIKTRSRDTTSDTNEVSKIVSTAHEQKAIKTNIETQKVSEESVGSENEMSGCESSSSNSESTFRRTLRNRIMDSPFQENDNKRTFKEPPTFVTPKSAKNEKEISNVLSSTSKRTLRSPAVETGNPNSSKKPKLETCKKSRFRNLHGSFEEVELPTVSSPQTTSKESSKLQEQPALLDKQKLNESSTIDIKKSTQNKNCVEIKESLKKVDEKVKDAKSSQGSVSTLRKKADNEATKEPTDKEILDINIKQVDKSVTNALKSTVQPVTNKANIKATVNKSPGAASVVISFSDWLKIKNQDVTNEPTDESAAAKESTQDILNRQSRARSRLLPKTVDSKLTEDKKGTIEADKVSQAQRTIICQDKEQRSGGSQLNSNIVQNDTTSHVIDIDNVLDESMDNGVLQLSDSNSQYNVKKMSVNIKNKKSSVKRLQTSSKVFSRSPKMETDKPKPSTPTRNKRNETDILIASMPKEMKDGGITDLLNTKAHVKRQRLPNRRLLNEGLEQQIPGTTVAAPTTRATKEKTLASAAVQLPCANTPNKELTKLSQFSENLQVQTTTAKNMNKSPTRRTPKQNIFTVSQRETSRKDVTLTASGDTKGLPVQTESEITNFATPIAVRSRKSMPILTKQSRDKIANVPSRKSLSTPKQQTEKNALPENSVFKMPKQAGSSTILNKIPTPSDASIKMFYTDDMKRPESRINIQHKEDILKKFKCRKPYVRLDRSIVETYFQSISNEEQQRLTRNMSSKKSVSEVPASTSTHISPIIQNNSGMSLRIQSVVDASNILNAVSPITRAGNQGGEGISLSTTNAFQDEMVGHAAMRNIQEGYILPNAEGTLPPLTTQINNAIDNNEIIELKHEFMDENPIGLINDAILPDTPTLLARAQTITEAAQHALSNSVTPTDIRLLTTDSSESNFVPSFGVTPRSLDNKGTCLYTFLHPAKYNRNHSNVLLDYCCPNLDGPMPAIDPTRIHAQVQVPIIELPASIVLTTKVVARSDLESGNTSIPAIIRKKAEKIRKNMATHHKLAVTTTAVNTQTTASILPPLAPSPRPSLPPTINALTKQLPSTTTITAKIRPPIPQQSQILITQPPVHPSPSIVASSVASSIPKNTPVSFMPNVHSLQLSDTQQSILRSNLRRFDVLLKQLVQPYESLSFADRHRVIEAVIASENFLPKALDQTLLLMEEYIKQTVLLKKNDSLKQPPASSTSAIMSTNNYTTSQASVASPLVTTQMPQLQPSPKILASSVAAVTPSTYSAQFEQFHNKKLQNRGKNSTSTAGSSSDGGLVRRHVPIYDTERNIIGYQMQMETPPPPAYTKPTKSTNSAAIMSTSLDSNKITAYCINKRPMKRPAQDSPRVFYTTPPLKTSTPKGIGSSEMYPAQSAKSVSTIGKQKGTIVTTVRSGGSSSIGSSETITTTTMATVKRVTRSTATGSKIIILSKSNQSNEESILPDDNSSQQQAEIKNEKDVEEFLG